MSLVGNLEDLGLGEILQIVSLSRKSGILSLQCGEREGKVYFEDGQVIRANTSSRRENLGELLLRKELVDLDTLKAALQIQKDEGRIRRLGEILEDRFEVSAPAIEAAVKEQIEKIVYGFFGWNEGTFSFSLGSAEESGETSFNPLRFMLDQGLNPQWLAMEGSRILDERLHRGEALEEEEEEGPVFDLDELLVDESLAVSKQQAVAEAASPGEQPGPAGQLYLIDDEAQTLSGLSQALREAGCSVHCFDDAEEYLYGVAAAVDAGEEPALLVDLIMPRKDGNGMLGGLELLEQVLGRYPDLAAMVMTEHPDPEVEEQLYALGVKAVVGKPKKGDLAKKGGAALVPLAEEALRQLFGEAASPDQQQAPAYNLGAELRREFGEQDTDMSRGPATPGLHLLREMLVELQSPSLGGGIILLVLRFAAELMNRAVIFAVKDANVIGLGQFGIQDEGENADARIRRMRIVAEDDSVFTTMLQTMSPMKITLGNGPTDTYVQQELGGHKPKEVFLGPILSEGKVVAILYGDNLPDDQGIGDTESLEIFLSQAGLAMEKAILERRLQSSR